MKVLGFKIKGEHVREQSVQSSRNVFDSLWGDIRWRVQRGFLAFDELRFG
jgi:hypothetical protein